MKSKVEIRIFAIEQATKIMAVGASERDVVRKAKEIEQYVIGDAALPDAYSAEDAIFDSVRSMLPVMGVKSVAKK